MVVPMVLGVGTLQPVWTLVLPKRDCGIEKTEKVGLNSPDALRGERGTGLLSSEAC